MGWAESDQLHLPDRAVLTPAWCGVWCVVRPIPPPPTLPLTPTANQPVQCGTVPYPDKTRTDRFDQARIINDSRPAL
jgi:hypothetical protein